MRAMGSKNYFSALSQEKTGDFWVNGRLFGRQTCHTAEDVERAGLLFVIGANPWLAHGFQRARDALHAIRKDPARKMIVADPRRTETAEMADVHLQLRPGTDAFLLGALLATLVRRELVDRAFVDEHTTGFAEVRDALLQIPVERFVAASGVDPADFEHAVELVAAAPSMTVRVELGLQQSRHSTLNSYLEKLTFLLTGNFGRPGTNNLHSWLTPLWGHSPDGDRSPVTGQARIGGLLPPNRLAEEILTDHPKRIRAMVVDSSNPANTAADTASAERALSALDLLVVVDVAMTETAALADYVLPASSQYEKWEATFFDFEFPENRFQLRAPIVEPLPGTLAEAEIYTRILRAMGDLPPEKDLAELRELATTSRFEFAGRLGGMLSSGFGAVAPVVLYETLGRTLPDGAAAAAPLWAAAHRLAGLDPEAVRAAGIEGDGPLLGEKLFARILSSPSGFVFTRHEYDDVWRLVATPDRRIRLAIPELLQSLLALDPAAVIPDTEHPFVLVAGQRRSHNANQIQRNPAWRKSDPDGALRIHPDDLAAIDAAAGGWVAVETEAGRIVVRAEADASMLRGVVSLPHGYGQAYPTANGQRLIDGPRLNQITRAGDRDPIAATPHHKNVAVRLTVATGAEAATAEDTSRAIRELSRRAAA
jgi:anaerobic selenocysteine-containing dehydrogenase